MKRTGALLAGMMLLLLSGVLAQDGVQVAEHYGDLPKGVVLEGGAGGMEALTSLEYDKKSNEFIINTHARYANPVSRKDFASLLKALEKSDNLGVTFVDDNARTYGDIGMGSQIAKDMIALDRAIGGIVFGIKEELKGINLPGNYEPLKPDGRKVRVVVFSAFKNFTFTKTNGVYTRTGVNMNTMLFPMSDKKSKLGGALPDLEREKDFVPEATDQKNLGHLKANQPEYFKMQLFARVLVWGEVAAFARHVRDSKIDSEAFLKRIE